MPTRRPLARTRATAQALPPRATPWIVNSRSITFIATWRGQLLVCTVAVVLGAIYFVLREPIGRWRRRQRERLSRLRGEELLSMDKGKQHPVTVLEDRAAGPSSRSASAVASVHSTTARERGREKRKEKKRERSGQTDPTSLATTSTTTSGPSGSSIDSSPSTHPTVIPKGAALEPSGLELDLNPVDAAPVGPRIISLESSASESPAEDSPLSASQLETLQARVSSVPTLCIDIGEDGFGSEATDSLSVSHSRSTSYSIIPEDLPLELTRSAGRKKKRRSKARSGSGPSLGIGPSLSMSRNTMVSSDETHSHSSPAMSAPSTPLSPRRRRELSLGGLPLTPALELLIGNNERTIDSLRAEIGHAKAEESKAREDETRARDDLRRARGAEDRMRHDYERARKARDRAEVDSRRLEAELLHIRSRFDALAHMYHAVCSRLRELEMSSEHPSVHHHAQHSPHLGSPGMGYPSPVPSSVGYFHYPAQSMYPSPLQPHGFANFVMSAAPHRRSEGSGGPDVLAGPLTPGLGGPETASTSQVSSPYPSDMSQVQIPETPATSATGTSDGQLSAAELRRMNIASSVLKKKKSKTDSDNGSNSPPDGRPMSLGRDAKEIVEGLGIRSFAGMPSTFESANGVRPPAQAPKPDSSSSASSDVSSAPTGRPLPETPSDSGPFRRAQSPARLSSPHLKNADAFPTEPRGESPALDASSPVKPLLSLATDTTAEVDYAPLFASLAHTPEQLAEIARIRQGAIRDRELRNHSRACSTSDTNL